MPLINMFVLHTHKDNALSLETVGFYGIDPEESLEEFFRLKDHARMASNNNNLPTQYHAKYFVHELTRTGGKGVDRLGRALFDSCVDLNPHQIEAALFALRSPLSKGVLLADEVGLGKTIEAGLVICQKWAENSRKILVISTASLRKQWAVELMTLQKSGIRWLIN